MILTSENYYSPEANTEYLSVSQFKDFVGTYGQAGCEAHALAKAKGEWQDEPTPALLVGSYVDAYWDDSLESFKQRHPEIFTKQGQLKADFRQADKVIERTLRDQKFCQYMSGQKQVIMTAEVFGTPWKIKIDSYHPCAGIVDLKVMKSIFKQEWVKDLGHLEFIRYWGYDVQAAVYQEVVYKNTGKRLPFFIAAVTKSDHPVIRVIQVPQNWLDEALAMVEAYTPRIVAIKKGEIEPIRCEKEDCHYCCDTYVIDKPIMATDLLGGL